MANQLETLQRLQDLDGKLYRLRRAQEEKPRELEQARERLTAEETTLKAVEERRKTLQIRHKEQEIELQSREANVKKLQGQLLQLKTNKEYTVMQHEIDTFKADNSLMEEDILQGFDAIDQVTKERAAQQQQVSSQQEHLRKETTRVERELAAIEQEISQLERRRGEITPDVPQPALSTYERILTSREGLALVPVVNESCGGCNRRLPPQVVNEVFLKARMVTCENCNRILYQESS